MKKVNGIIIFEVEEVKDAYVNDINCLLAQLSSSPAQFIHESLTELVNSPSSHLFFAESEGRVVGMLTIGEYLAPTGKKMWVEDVVVDESMRGLSIGRMLVEYAISFANSLGCGNLMLTSRPSRVAANALYRSCGFQLKETNMYRMKVGENRND